LLSKIDKYISLLGLKIQGDLGPFTCYTSQRGRIVWFLKAPPKEPATWEQKMRRNVFAFAAQCWQTMEPETRQRWNEAARRANLRISGYNLLTYFISTDDREVLRTIMNQTGIVLELK